MTTHTSKTLTTARLFAMRFRKKGFNATVFKTKKGFKVSVTKK